MVCHAGEPAPQTIDQLTASIAKVLRETGAPGAGLAIVSRDKVLTVAGIGMADPARKWPATALACAVAALYLGYWGMWAVRTWS